ncbi:putative membrane-associated kinase regulator 2 [Vitis vinifera]|uniref:Putative membrane-associated kinase regulator 2 n=1 Tax=Vitis vinifera TaxID=29760 RepID=A0A438G7C8_VITVI|nr:putative membrane-associated kinase regulator 2 [Vitis vinifera]
MDVLSFLKLWKGGGSAPTAASGDAVRTTSLRHVMVETDDEDSFFDLELAVPQNKEENSNKSGEGGSAHELFFKRRILPIESSSKPQSPISLLRSAPRFRVEEVPVVSVFTRENSSRSFGKHGTEETTSFESKRFSKDVVHKYLKLIKPLYIKVSKKYGEKTTSSPSPSSSPIPGPIFSPKKPVKTQSRREDGEERPGSLPAGLRVVCKHLGKSRSASAAVQMMPPVSFQASRRDDSLAQQHDGIQSAIMHCKRSLNSSTGTELISINHLFFAFITMDQRFFSRAIPGLIKTISRENLKLCEMAGKRYSSVCNPCLDAKKLQENEKHRNFDWVLLGT